MGRIVWDCLQILRTQEKNESNFGILILNRPILCRPELINSLWEKAIMRGLVDGGSNRWLDFLEKYGSLNVKLPDFISGDFDSLKPRTRGYFEPKGVTFIPTPDQDETDFTKGLRCLADHFKERNLNVKWFVIICENSGRFDQTIANINTLHRSKKIVGDTPVFILSCEDITWVLPPGEHTICVTKDFVEAQYTCGLIPFCGPTVITTSGLKWDMDNCTCEFGELVSTSNTFASTEINITCDRDIVWTTQYSKIDQ